jgi:HPt (histidine-containing phosphotransfer) domain-containing protein
MPAEDALSQLKAAMEQSAKRKSVGKEIDQAKKLLAQLTKAQTSAQAAKKELDGESDDA